MLQISGVVAFAITALAATLLFSNVKSVEIAGVVQDFHSGRLDVKAVDRPGLPRPGGASLFGLPVAMGVEDDGRPVDIFLEAIDPAAEALPEGSEVRVSVRWVVFTGILIEYLCFNPVWGYAGTRIESGGRTYSWETSIPVFYTGLTVASLLPVLLWSLVAIPFLFLRRGDRTPGVRR